jgi:hypothetical protein
LDKVLLLGEGHLSRVLRANERCYNQARPDQGIEQQCPIPFERVARDGPIERRDILGGVLHDYFRRAA